MRPLKPQLRFREEGVGNGEWGMGEEGSGEWGMGSREWGIGEELRFRYTTNTLGKFANKIVQSVVRLVAICCNLP